MAFHNQKITSEWKKREKNTWQSDWRPSENRFHCAWVICLNFSGLFLIINPCAVWAKINCSTSKFSKKNRNEISEFPKYFREIGEPFSYFELEVLIFARFPKLRVERVSSQYSSSHPEKSLIRIANTPEPSNGTLISVSEISTRLIFHQTFLNVIHNFNEWNRYLRIMMWSGRALQIREVFRNVSWIFLSREGRETQKLLWFLSGSQNTLLIELPPKASCKSLVNFESAKGIIAFKLIVASTYLWTNCSKS